MSLYAASDFGYIQQAEAYFLSLSRVGVFVSSRDTELLKVWRAKGISIEVVCAGIRQTFLDFLDPPRSIYQCRHHVDFEIRARRAAQTTSRRDRVDSAAPLPGRDLPDPTDPKVQAARRARLGLRGPQGRVHAALEAKSPQGADDQARARVHAQAHSAKTRGRGAQHRAFRPGGDIPLDERFLTTWYRSMNRLTELGRGAKHELVRELYRWAWRQMIELRIRALQETDRNAVALDLPLAIGAIESEVFQRAYDGLDDDQRAALDTCVTPPMHRALRRMTPEARDHQLSAWRRRILTDVLELEPFFTPF